MHDDVKWHMSCLGETDWTHHQQFGLCKNGWLGQNCKHLIVTGNKIKSMHKNSTPIFAPGNPSRVIQGYHTNDEDKTSNILLEISNVWIGILVPGLASEQDIYMTDCCAGI